MIEALVTTNSKIIIDPTVEIISNSPAQEIQFTFQAPWAVGYKLYALFKPAWDTPVSVELDAYNCCLIPILKYNKYFKLGIALAAVDTNTNTMIMSTNYYYINVIRGACMGTLFPPFKPDVKPDWPIYPDDPSNPDKPGTDDEDHPYDTDDDSFTFIQGDSYDTNLLLAGVDDYSIIDHIQFVSSGADVCKDLIWDEGQGNYRVYFSPEETAQMPAGKFTYDIIVYFTDGDQQTVIYEEDFTIKERSNVCDADC